VECAVLLTVVLDRGDHFGGGTLAKRLVGMERSTITVLLDIVERSMHASRSEWLFFRELRVGTGRRNGNVQRLDAFALVPGAVIALGLLKAWLT
jgi:hypothetical protein